MVQKSQNADSKMSMHNISTQLQTTISRSSTFSKSETSSETWPQEIHNKTSSKEEKSTGLSIEDSTSNIRDTTRHERKQLATHRDNRNSEISRSCAGRDRESHNQQENNQESCHSRSMKYPVHSKYFIGIVMMLLIRETSAVVDSIANEPDTEVLDPAEVEMGETMGLLPAGMPVYNHQAGAGIVFHYLGSVDTESSVMPLTLVFRFSTEMDEEITALAPAEQNICNALLLEVMKDRARFGQLIDHPGIPGADRTNIRIRDANFSRILEDICLDLNLEGKRFNRYKTNLLREIKREYKEIQDILHPNRPHMAMHVKPARPARTGLEKNLRQMQKRLLRQQIYDGYTETSGLHSEYTSTLAPQREIPSQTTNATSHTRTKRGIGLPLLNVLSGVIGGLFSVRTFFTIKRVQKSVSLLHSLVNRQFNKVFIAQNTLASAVKLQSKHLAHLALDFRSMRANFDKFASWTREQIQGTRAIIQSEVNRFMVLTEMLIRIRRKQAIFHQLNVDKLQDVYHEISKKKQMLINLASHKLDTELLPLAVSHTIVKQLQTILDVKHPELSLGYQSGLNLYQQEVVGILLPPNQIMVLLNVPIIRHDSNFILYKAQSYLQRLPGNAPNVMSRVAIGKNSVLGISVRGEAHMITSQEKLAQCQFVHARKLFLCDKQFLVKNALDDQDCLHELFQSKVEQSKKTCKQEVVISSEITDQVIQTGDREFYVSSSDKSVTLDCTYQTSARIDAKVPTIFTIPCKCKFKIGRNLNYYPRLTESCLDQVDKDQLTKRYSYNVLATRTVIAKKYDYLNFTMTSSQKLQEIPNFPLQIKVQERDDLLQETRIQLDLDTLIEKSKLTGGEILLDPEGHYVVEESGLITFLNRSAVKIAIAAFALSSLVVTILIWIIFWKRKKLRALWIIVMGSCSGIDPGAQAFQLHTTRSPTTSFDEKLHKQLSEMHGHNWLDTILAAMVIVSVSIIFLYLLKTFYEWALTRMPTFKTAAGRQPDIPVSQVYATLTSGTEAITLPYCNIQAAPGNILMRGTEYTLQMELKKCYFTLWPRMKVHYEGAFAIRTPTQLMEINMPTTIPFPIFALPKLRRIYRKCDVQIHLYAGSNGMVMHPLTIMSFANSYEAGNGYFKTAVFQCKAGAIETIAPSTANITCIDCAPSIGLKRKVNTGKEPTAPCITEYNIHDNTSETESKIENTEVTPEGFLYPTIPDEMKIASTQPFQYARSVINSPYPNRPGTPIPSKRITGDSQY